MQPFTVKTDDNLSKFGIFSKLIENRILFLYEEITTNVISDLIAVLLYLDIKNPEEEITIYINSIGGDVDALFALYDAFQMISAPISTIAIGKAYSAAAVILSAGTPGRRFICPTAQIMIHHIQISDMTGSKTEIDAEIERIDEANKLLVEILARHTGKTISEIDEDCQNDTYFTAKQAVQYGLVDAILPMNKKQPKLLKRKAKRKK